MAKKAFSWFVLFVGIVVGIIFWGGFNTFMEYTNSYEFCISCHEMNIVKEEYQQSVHAHNPSGVPAVCSDCHVPKPWTEKLARKIMASKELYHKVIGTIDTPEKFEAHRLELAQNVWRSMEATDSRECRNCHTKDTMVVEKQSAKAQKMHKRLLSGEATCINCHKGIAHKLPDMEKIYTDMEKRYQAKAYAAQLGDKAVVILNEVEMVTAAGSEESLATLYGGTPLRVIKQEGDWVQVASEGWDREEGSQIYIDFNRAVILAKMSFDGMEKVEKLETKLEPEYELNWNRIKLTGWVPRTALGTSDEEFWNYVTGLYDLDCNLCHKTFPRDKWIMFDWRNNLKEMLRFTKLSPEQLQLVTNWVLRGARDDAEGD
ncbi:MAG: NapC/NirT family cytochrome c [Gammaproteobacteria bacterium]|nr:NapC/NirT family cytochrome c [Gammaproteobacteria bacterium]NNJ90652.1 cytochrome C [Gammaproteobacteria bacterium]